MTAAASIAGTRCETCGRSMVFGVCRAAEVPVEALHRALWLVGAVQISVGTWVCWGCSLTTPRRRLEADAYQQAIHTAIELEARQSGVNVPEQGWQR